MPRGNGTGPMGMGPMTGRAAGFCAGNNVAGCMNSAFGRGCGMGFGRGRGMGGQQGGLGRRNMFHATGLPGWMRTGVVPASYQDPDPELEKQSLKSYAKSLESELESAKKRLEEIEKASK